MNLKTTYLGGSDPFEGDLKIWLRSLPMGAKIIGANINLDPVNAPDFKETFVFDAKDLSSDQLLANDWGVFKNSLFTLPRIPTTTPPTTNSFLEVYFDSRRRLSGVSGRGEKPTLKVDMGGAYIGVADDGTFVVPGKYEMQLDLSVGEASLPGLIVNKFMLTEPTSTGIIFDISKVSIRSVPTNVSLRLGDMPPFWTYIGEMATAKTSTGFADVLNAFLAGAEVQGGFYVISLIVHSDAISRLNITISIDYRIQQSILPSYLPQATLPYGYSSLPGVDDALTAVKLPRGAMPAAGTGGKLQGTFDSSRVVVGSIGESVTTDVVEISPDRTLSQPIQVGEETQVSRIDLPLGNTETGLAGLNLALQDDADGKPSGMVLISADIAVEKPVPGGSAWGSAKLPSEFRFLKDKRYWLIIQSISGNAYWETMRSDAGAMALQGSSDGGLSWRTAATKGGQGPLQAIFRLRYTPAKYSIPVSLQIGRGPGAVRVGFDQFAPLGRVDFGVDFSAGLGDYLSGPAGKSPCDLDDLIVNGNFEQPPYDDATIKLFGFDSYKAQSIQSNVKNLERGVDLRIQRFIRLSIDNKPPIKIDCAGVLPARTTPTEIVSAINKAIGRKGASYSDKLKILEIESSLNTEAELFQWCSLQISGWKKASGQILRVEWKKSIFALLLALPLDILASLDQACFGGNMQSLNSLEPTVLSQSVIVSGGCPFNLQFSFLAIPIVEEDIIIPSYIMTALSKECPVLPSWGVRWLDVNGSLIDTQSAEIDVSKVKYFDEDGLSQYEVRIIAPTGSAKADLQFIQPQPGLLLISDVSFKPTLESLDNGSFLRWDAQVGAQDDHPLPSGWVDSGWVDQVPIKIEQTGIVLRGDGPEDAMLIQATGVTPGKHYILEIDAWPDMGVWPYIGIWPEPPKDAEMKQIGERARVELRWLVDKTIVGDPVILPLDGRDFPGHLWAGDAPAGANQAEVRLVLPKGSSHLVVKSVSLEESDLISVPLIFLSETPGELTISNLNLVYDQLARSKHIRPTLGT